MPVFNSVNLDGEKEEALITGCHNVVVSDGSIGGRGWECGKLSHLYFFVSWDIFHLNYLIILHDAEYLVVIYAKNSEMTVR